MILNFEKSAPGLQKNCKIVQPISVNLLVYFSGLKL